MNFKLDSESYKIYKKRNIDMYVHNKFFGVHKLLPIKHSKFARKFEKFKLKISLKFGRIFVPQVEIAITTKCNLACKNCTNFIPLIANLQQRLISLVEFKLFVDNLTANIARLNSLILLGGEPLLHNDLPQMLLYATANKKIENVYIITNGTMDFSDKLKDAFRKCKHKLCVWVSNYTANEKLAKVLKTHALVEFLKHEGYIFMPNSRWSKVAPPKFQYRTNDENSAYFLACNTPCVSVYGNEMSICPRASHFALTGKITQNNQTFNGGGGLRVSTFKLQNHQRAVA